ncbi:MAG: hypothetical protein J0M04_05060 [Verrucomicrobia bacterium]|nr:hypothetical protein [Verrucomicrobiota bacterium]
MKLATFLTLLPLALPVFAQGSKDNAPVVSSQAQTPPPSTDCEHDSSDPMISDISKYDRDQLLTYAAGLNLPDSPIKTLHPKYLALKADIAALRKQGFGDQHPFLAPKIKELDAVATQIDLALDKLKGSIQPKLGKPNSLPPAASGRAEISLSELRQRLDTETALLKQLTAKLAEIEATSPESAEAKELKLTIREQADIVDQVQRLLNQVIKTKGILYLGPVQHPDNGSRPPKERKALLEHRLKFITTLEGEDLYTFVGNLDLRDNPVPDLHQRYLAATLTLDALRIKGVGNGHPEWITAEKSTSAIKARLDTAVQAIRKTLEAELDIVSAQIPQSPVVPPPQQ